jgi:tetratricopeptide (TPR) repeat protein
MDVEQYLAQAQAKAESQEWGEAAALFETVARALRQSGRREQARQVWGVTGELWRRDDWPSRSASALREALTLSEGEDQARASVQLGAVLGEIGRPEEALRWAQRGLVGEVAPIARDAVCGHFLALGRVTEAMQWVPPRTEGPEGAAHFFRRAQLARLDGRFEDALAALSEATGRLDGSAAQASGRAAALGEQIEILLLSDQPSPAIPLAEAAISEHRKAGRKSMAWRAEASRVRAVSAAGLLVPSTLLDPGLQFSRERAMPLLEADLLLARASFGPTPGEDLTRAAELGESSWVRRGRALLGLASLRQDSATAAEALRWLQPSRPWAARAERLLASLP